jgi:gamma-glutamyltranspeptidase/glutathione hydrolase
MMSYPTLPLYPTRRSPVFARNTVATSHPLATEAGLDMLHRGGNAVDAALAAAITLVVVEPTGNGLGSDAFCILWDGEGLQGLNASGRSPAAWTPERFAGQAAMPRRGWETVTVPGAVSAWVELSEKYGKLPFATLFEAAIRYAEEGFHVTPVVAKQWAAAANELHSQPGFAEAFMPEGRAPRAGEMFRLPAMAETLRQIAATKGEAFYRGPLAEKIADFAALHGAALSREDLAAHELDWCGTIEMGFGTSTLNEIPPNGQGIAALMALGILKHTKIADYMPDSAEALHLQIEAMKLAFADIHAFVADNLHMSEVTSSHLLDETYLASRAALIDPTRALDHPTGAPKEGGTVCLAVGDESGMMVSYIQSNYSGFGSGVVVPGTGISLQNRGHGFVTTPGHPNEVGPRKRPFHTIIPGFVMKEGRPEMAFGLMGGPIQAQGHLQMMLRSQLWGQDPQTCADAPRWRVVKGLEVLLEAGMDETVVAALSALGHEVGREAHDASFGFGGAQLVQRIAGGYVAGSDPRKDGCASGF